MIFIFMSHLNIFIETFTNGLYYDFLNFLSLGSIICGISVIIAKNPIVSVLYLIGLFLNIAIYLMMLGIHFIGLSYLLVYVGAVSILFLFILMLINVRISELVTDNNNNIPLAIIIGTAFIFTLYNLFPSQFTNNFLSSYLPWLKQNINFDQAIKFSFNKELNVDLPQTSLSFNDLRKMSSLFKEGYLKGDELYFATTSTWDGSLVEFSHITSIGNILYTVYPMWLIITSLILLLAMVGAIVITIKQ